MTFHILDTDAYKLTTSYAYMTLFPQAECTFKFQDRNNTPRTKAFLDRYKALWKDMSIYMQTIHEDQYRWLCEKMPFIPPHYWEWLSSFRYDYSKINAYLDENHVLNVEVTDKCYKATLYEIPCLFLVTEVDNEHRMVDLNMTHDQVLKKIDLSNESGMRFAEFGTRRRFSQDNQMMVVRTLKEFAKNCVGTSNVWMAYLNDMTPIGTHPHEWFMFHGAQYGYNQANYLALENWVKVYDGNLGIALTDTYGTDNFFENFSLKHAKLFDGLRQDSGSEDEFVRKATEFYASKKINPKHKTIIFSNGLNFLIGVKLWEKHRDTSDILCCFGTDLTNDVYNEHTKERYKAENIVMKMSKCRMNDRKPWMKCVKLSDDAGKHTGNTTDVLFCKYVVGYNK